MRLFKLHPSLPSNDYANTEVLQPDYWVIASRETNQVRVSTGLIETSQDLGNTWDNSIAFTDANLIMHGYLYENGNISLFTTDNKIYKTTLELTSVDEVVLYEDDRVTPYVFHTPSNPSFPGAYLEVEDHQAYDDSGVHVLANYCNSAAINGGRGASAVITPMSDDYGNSWIVSYEFGQNLRYRDNGTATGGSGGTILGDASNTNLCRHVHTIEYNPFEDIFYMNTGDQRWGSAPFENEIGWYKGTYNSSTRDMTWVRVDFGFEIERTSNLKATGMFFTETHIYWGSDANPVVTDEQHGIWRSPIGTFDDVSTHEQVYQLTGLNIILCMKLDPNTNTLLAITGSQSGTDFDTLLAIKNNGFGEAQTKQFVGAKFLRLNGINSDGFFRMDYELFSTLQTKTFFIKIGDDLFSNI